MSGTTLSDRLKNVEDELNDITSLMSIRESQSSSQSDTTSRTGSDTSILLKTTSSDRLALGSRRSSRAVVPRSVATTTNTSSKTAMCAVRSKSDNKLKDDYQSSRSTSASNGSSGNSNSSGECGVGNKRKKTKRSAVRRENVATTGLVHTLLQLHSHNHAHAPGRHHHQKEKLDEKADVVDQKVSGKNDRPKSGASHSPKRLTALPVILPPSMCGDTVVPDFESVQTYLHSINSTIIKGNQAVSVLSKVSGISADFNKPSSAPCSHYGSQVPKRYKDLLKEISDERTKRLSTEKSVDQIKGELKRYKQECKKNKESNSKYCQMNQQMEKENLLVVQQLKTLERTNEEMTLQIDMHKQKYEALLKDLQIDKERRWEQEREMKRMKDCLDQSHAKIQELMGAKTMAMELAHDLQKKHQTFVIEHQLTIQELKTKNMDLEKMVGEMKVEKSHLTERAQLLDEATKKCEEMQLEMDECKRSLGTAQKTVYELTRNPEGIPQVRSMLDTQEQSFKAALTEKATSEMALQAKYTTLEVELQIIQEEHIKRIGEMDEEKRRLTDESKWKQDEVRGENDKLKLVIEELTELTNQYKARINELSDINKHQEVLIKCQNEAISSKEERVRLTNQEADLNIRRADQERKTMIAEHEKEVAHLKKALEEEQDKVRVKDKMADDQAESIMHLKQNVADRVKEVQKRSKEAQRLEMSLKQEKQEKENLMCDVQHLKMLRTRMRDQINELNGKVDTLNANTVHKKHTIMLEDLERKVAIKQSEWDSEISKLKTERDQARETAQYAIENLSNALEEYQREVTAQKSLQTNMAALIKEKEEQLTVAENKVKKLEQDKLYLEMVPIGDRKRYMSVSPDRHPVKATSATLKHTQKEMADTHSHMMQNLSLQNMPFNY